MRAVAFGMLLGAACQRASEREAEHGSAPVAAAEGVFPATDPAALEAVEPSGPGAVAEPEWVVGAQSRARALPLRWPRHDGDPGATRIELQPRASGAAPHVIEREGAWHCLGYVAVAHAYLFGVAAQRGEWLPLVSLELLDEGSAAWRASRATGPDWLALSAVAAPDGRFFAFVAQSSPAGFELELFDPATDSLVRAGAAPTPPPASDPTLCTDEPFVWGDVVGGYVPMDPGVIELDERTLVVRYGDDTCSARSPRRRERRIDVLELFTRRARATPSG